MTLDAANNDLSSSQVFFIKEGLLNGWICAPKSMSLDEVNAAIGGWVSGTSIGWCAEQRDCSCKELGQDHSTGHCKTKSPGLCAEDENRQHWEVFC